MIRGKDETRRVTAAYTAFQFFFSLLLWIPVFYAYQKRMGLSDTQIFAIQSLYYLAFCVLEIPTGFLADRFSYLLCMRIGTVTLIAANLLPVFWVSYPGFVSHWMLIAVSRSLISGAASAYLYDFLGARGRADEFKKVEGRARSYGLIGKVLGWAAIGALMKWHVSLPYSLTAGSAAVALVFALRLPQLPEKPASRAGAGLVESLAPVGRMLLTRPFLAISILQGVAIFVLVRMLQVNLFQPILETKGFDLGVYGAVMSLTTIFEAAGSFGFRWPGGLRRRLGNQTAVLVLSALAAVSLALVSVSGLAGTLVGLCLFSLASGLIYPIQRQVVNDAIPDSTYRATLLSVESIIDRAACAWAATFLAGFVGTGRVGEFLRILAVLTVVLLGALYFALCFLRKRVSSGSREPSRISQTI